MSAATPTPAKVPAESGPAVRGRYIMFKLLRQFLRLPPRGQHDCLMAAEFTVEEAIALTKAFNGVKYHKLRRRQANFLTLPKEF